MAEQLELATVGGPAGRKQARKSAAPAVSVVIPAYNEQGAVAATVASVREVLDAAGIAHEIIVVNDGSSDDTLARARGTGAQVVNFPHNGGYGRALKAGIAVSTAPLVAILDAEGRVRNRKAAPRWRNAASRSDDEIYAELMR